MDVPISDLRLSTRIPTTEIGPRPSNHPRGNIHPMNLKSVRNTSPQCETKATCANSTVEYADVRGRTCQPAVMQQILEQIPVAPVIAQKRDDRMPQPSRIVDPVQIHRIGADTADGKSPCSDSKPDSIHGILEGAGESRFMRPEAPSRADAGLPDTRPVPGGSGNYQSHASKQFSPVDCR